MLAEFGVLADKHARSGGNLVLLLVSMLQSVGAAPRETIDLTIAQPCGSLERAPDEVVVCANRDGESPYRLKQPPPPPKDIPDARVKIAEGVEASAQTEEVDVGGFPSNRAMIRLKISF